MLEILKVVFLLRFLHSFNDRVNTILDLKALNVTSKQRVGFSQAKEETT